MKINHPVGPKTVWLLDLDNTLHDALATTFPRIKLAMGQFIERELELSGAAADALRDHYGRRYGATLLGLVKHHQVDAARFLHDAHKIADLHRLIRADKRLGGLLRQLPGRRVLLTNAPLIYAREVVRLLGIKGLLHQIVSIESMQFAGRLEPKPSRPMFQRLIASQRVSPARCILVEDSIENLRAARSVGIAGVVVTGFTHRHDSHRHAARAFTARGIARRLRSVHGLGRQAAGGAGS